jgi:hypothetical protein
MAEDTTFTAADVERVAAQVDARCADLGEADRRVLEGVFALAGTAAAAQLDDDVSGFLMPTDMPALTFSAPTAAPDMRKAGGSKDVSGGMFLAFKFQTVFVSS